MYGPFVYFHDYVYAEVAASFCSEVSFYIGLAIFLLVADHVQKPYIQFSPKRWGLITGLRGYMTSAFLAMGLKVVASLLAVYVTWPALGLPALVAVAPFLAGCLVQLVFEAHLNRRGSSCWPLVPIIFEVCNFLNFPTSFRVRFYLCGGFSVQTLWETWLAIGFQNLFLRKFRNRKCQRDISKLSITISTQQ